MLNFGDVCKIEVVGSTKDQVDLTVDRIHEILPIEKEYFLNAIFHSKLQELTKEYNITIKVPQTAEGEEPKSKF